MKMFVIFKEQEKSISFGNYTYNNTSQKKKGGGKGVEEQIAENTEVIRNTCSNTSAL